MLSYVYHNTLTGDIDPYWIHWRVTWLEVAYIWLLLELQVAAGEVNGHVR